MRRLTLGVLVIVAIAGCVDRSRVNANCGWTGDRAVPLDLSKPADRRHLIADAQLAEELAVRYADGEHQRLYGYSGHGGAIDHGRLLRGCMAHLFTTIETTHGVSAEQVQVARAQRNPGFDATVWLSFLLVYCLGATVAARWIARRFAPRPSLGVTAFASVAVSFLGVQAGMMWSMVGEIIRLGNGHFGVYRATRNPWGQHLPALFVTGVVLFWIVALLQDRGEVAMGDGTPHGVVLH